MSHAAIEITTEHFQTLVLQSALPVLVDFGAEWCPPCKMIAPIVDELARKYEGKLVVGSLDVDAHPEIQQFYGVMGLPTLILFQHGEPVKRIVGFQPRERLEAHIKPYLQVEQTT
jgi:thioredoxin 1